ncbi:substance-K receptor-like [Penaeus japonicus]|uniref:substance-K receptor-like n=1 Tax=Penaeus japonicus TaxID=27405 RepID=UPI001C70C4A5|nr:substance-K receptor-like [Penaeus japonicus]
MGTPNLTEDITKLSCNETCCIYSDNKTICFGDFNFTERTNLTYPEPWELGVRYTFASLIMLVGASGNLCIIILLLKNKLLLRTSVNHFILNMSIADLITSLAGPIPFTIRDTHPLWVLGETWCHLEGYIQILVMLVSVTSLATISFDRMVGVVYPFHKHLGSWGSRAIIIGFWLLSAVLALPFSFYRVYAVRIWQDLTERTCGEQRDEIRIWWIVVIIALTWLPLLVMVISYTVIFVYLRKGVSVTARREHPAILHLKKRVVRMMFVILMVFILSWLPFQIMKIFEDNYITADGHYLPDQEAEYKILLSVSHYMMYVNSAVNPVIYGLMHQTFRRAFRVTFTCFYRKKSSFILRPSRGTNRYVWSTDDSVYTNNMNRHMKRKLRDRLRRAPQVTPQALVCTPALAASIALQQSILKGSSDAGTKQDVTMTDLGNPSTGTNPASEDPSEGSAKSKVRLNTFVNEGFVRDLSQRRLSVASTGALGHLITEVIEEESSSDVDNSERIL